jgi:hypothetical protein
MESVNVTSEIKEIAIKKAIDYKLQPGCQILMAVESKMECGYETTKNRLWVVLSSDRQLYLVDSDSCRISNPTGETIAGSGYKMVTKKFG